MIMMSGIPTIIMVILLLPIVVPLMATPTVGMIAIIISDGDMRKMGAAKGYSIMALGESIMKVKSSMSTKGTIDNVDTCKSDGSLFTQM